MKIANLIDVFKRKETTEPFLKDEKLHFEHLSSDPVKANKYPLNTYDYIDIKHELKQKRIPNNEIARRNGISQTTLYLIKKSTSFKNYKLLRRQHSKPHVYN